jgi:hypothetical protein
MSVTDLFDTVREPLESARDFADDELTVSWFADALAALASIEERLKVAERERDELREYRDQMNEILSREDIHDYWFGIGKSCSLGEAFSDLLARVAELESELTDSEINFRDQLDRARAAEARCSEIILALQHRLRTHD